MVPRLQAEELAVRALKFAELNRRPECHAQRPELAAETFERRRIAAETGGIDFQPLANIFDAIHGKAGEILVEFVGPKFVIAIKLPLRETAPRCLQFLEEHVTLV